MSAKKMIIIYSALFIILFVALWYFFLKSWDYKVSFKVNAHSSVVYTRIIDWDKWNSRNVEIDQISYHEKLPWEKINMTFELKDTTILFNWYLKAINDSLTRVSVNITDPDRKLKNRASILFGASPFVKNVKRNMVSLKRKLNEFTKSFNYELTGEEAFKEKQCVYLSAEGPIREKATEMIKNVVQLNLFVKDNELGLDGHPFVEIHNWSPDSDSIYFDFCFPILHPERLPEHDKIRLKTVAMSKALHGNFFGNYSLSDMSWYRLHETAGRNQMNPTGRIIEEFFRAPHAGGNELDWKAGIYLELD